MPELTIPTTPPVPIRVGQRRIVSLVEAVGPALPATAAYPHLAPATLEALLSAAGETYTDPSGTFLAIASQGFAILGAGLRPTFPAAEYLITRPELEHATATPPPVHVTDSVLPPAEHRPVPAARPGRCWPVPARAVITDSPRPAG
jgi:hypothetical protein